jgi:hypothetical protein
VGAAVAAFGAAAGALVAVVGYAGYIPQRRPHLMQSLGHDLRFLRPLAATFGWRTTGRELLLLAAALAGAGLVAWVLRETVRVVGPPRRPRVVGAGLALAGLGAVGAELAAHAGRADAHLHGGALMALLAGTAAALAGAIVGGLPPARQPTRQTATRSRASSSPSERSAKSATPIDAARASGRRRARESAQS